MKHIAIVVLALAATSFAEDVEVDLSQMKGSPVAMTAEPITNRLWLTSTNVCVWQTYATNGFIESKGTTTAQGLLDVANRTGKTPELVELLVKSGEVCKARGHTWQFGCGMDGCLVMHPGEMRHCGVCGKTETKEPSNWK